MNIKFQARRASILLQQCADIDKAIRDISVSIASRILISRSSILNEKESYEIEKRINYEVDKVMFVPAASVPGITLRRDLLRRLAKVRNYADCISMTDRNNYGNECR